MSFFNRVMQEFAYDARLAQGEDPALTAPLTQPRVGQERFWRIASGVDSPAQGARLRIPVAEDGYEAAAPPRQVWQNYAAQFDRDLNRAKFGAARARQHDVFARRLNDYQSVLRNHPDVCVGTVIVGPDRLGDFLFLPDQTGAQLDRALARCLSGNQEDTLSGTCIVHPQSGKAILFMQSPKTLASLGITQSCIIRKSTTAP